MPTVYPMKEILVFKDAWSIVIIRSIELKTRSNIAGETMAMMVHMV